MLAGKSEADRADRLAGYGATWPGDAADRGAEVRTRCPVTKLERADGLWRVNTPQT